MASADRKVLTSSLAGQEFLALIDKRLAHDGQMAAEFTAAGARLVRAGAPAGKENALPTQPNFDPATAVVTLRNLSLANPRGKFDMAFSDEAICVSNAKTTLLVPTRAITHVAILDQIPGDAKKRCLLLVVLDRSGPTVMHGKQRLEALVVQTLESDTLSAASSRGEALEGPAVAVLCQALGLVMPGFDSFIAPDPAVFCSAKGAVAIPCVVGVSPGALFPLPGALAFVERPAMLLPHGAVAAVEYRRPQSATWDLVLHMRPSISAEGGGGSGKQGQGQVVEFSQIDRSELGRLQSYFAAARIKPYDPAAPTGAGPGGAGPSGAAAAARQQADVAGGESDEEDEDDEDFDPRALEREMAGRPSKRQRTTAAAGAGAGPGPSGAGPSGAGPSYSIAASNVLEGDDEDEEEEEASDEGSEEEEGDGSDSYDEEAELADLTDEDDVAAEHVRQRARRGDGGKRVVQDEEEDDYESDEA